MTDVSITLAVKRRATTAQEVETSLTNNSLSKDYPYPDDHARQTTDTPGFKPFTIKIYVNKMRAVSAVISKRCLHVKCFSYTDL